jgi:gluconate 2-dehydrogenase alpha chain
LKTLPKTDVVIVGGGWTGLLVAKEIGQRTALNVVILERGGPRHQEDYANDMDELDFNVRLSMMQDYSKETVTLRHAPSERAIPIRQLGNFLPGTGTGGAGEHWSAMYPRHVSDLFEMYTKTVERYGAKKLPEDHAIVDWGITWADIEPYYTRSDKLIGTSGKAGNLRGKIAEGGNPFEGPRSEEYPTAPLKISYFSSLFQDAAKSLGYHPYPNPSAILSSAYTNPDGIARPACYFCGYCERFGCMVNAKSQPTNTLLPVVEKQKSVALRNNCSVRKIVYEGNHARGVNYVDAAGEECFQPADVVLLCSWTLNNTRLLLLSGIGEPYDPATGKGVVGRNLTHQVNASGGVLFMDKPLNRFMGAAASGIAVSDFDGDNFDHTSLPFIRGGMFRVVSGGSQPIASFGNVPPSAAKARWGSEWKKAAVYWYDRVGAIGFSGEHIPYKTNFMDLDPSYKDHLGDPLLRLTIDWHDNEREMVKYASAKGAEIAKAMGPKEIVAQPPFGHYDTRRYQSTHVQGGTIMGKSPEGSVVNTWGQHWQAQNLFVIGASTMPCQGAANPTPTVLALAYRTVDAVIDRYLKKPGSLA